MNLTFEYPEHLYTVEDLNKAFGMGLETAVYVLDKSLDLSTDGQRYLINCMKKKNLEDKVKRDIL